MLEYRYRYHLVSVSFSELVDLAGLCDFFLFLIRYRRSSMHSVGPPSHRRVQQVNKQIELTAVFKRASVSHTKLLHLSSRLLAICSYNCQYQSNHSINLNNINTHQVVHTLSTPSTADQSPQITQCMPR